VKCANKSARIVPWSSIASGKNYWILILLLGSALLASLLTLAN
jgi:hypothetical protein